MALPSVIQGRRFGPKELAQIQALLNEHPDWSRYRLSQELATQWDWRTATGQLKDMAARTLLLKLHQQGWIELPKRRMASPRGAGRQERQLSLPWTDQSPLECPLPNLLPLQIQEVSQRSGKASRSSLEQCLRDYHYLGYRSRVGQNLQYWVHCSQGRRLACVVFGAAAWQCAVRDQWIGWNQIQRARHLCRIANNTRFMILPWIRVDHLASHVLGRIIRRLRADWLAKYQHPIELVETFVDRQRFSGVCYRAANWIALGQTQGRGRQGLRTKVPPTSIKDVYVYPLHRRFRQHLTPPSDESIRPN